MTDPANLSRTWALIPLRGLADAKTRLSGSLNPLERQALVLEMATRTLAAARDARTLSGTVLVTADSGAAELATAFGARTIVQRLPGLNAALREARADAVRAGATAILVLPIDLPAISAEAINALVTVAEGVPAQGGVVLAVPDRHGRGTNALLVAPPGTIEPAFGEASFGAHAGAAAAAGATFVRVEGPLTLDVDTGADLLAVIPPDANGRDAA